MQIKEWSSLDFTNCNFVLKMMPKNTIKVNVSSWFPEQINDIIDAKFQLTNCILLTNYDVWRYNDYFCKKNYNGKIVVGTLGYYNVKYSDCYYELSLPVYYFSRKKYFNIEDKPGNLQYGFSCLNNRTSIDRILLGYELFRENLLDKLIFSQNLHPTSEYEYVLNIFFEHHYSFIFEYFDFSKYNEYRSLLPIAYNNETVFVDNGLNLTIQHDAYLNAYCNIVTESECESWPYYLDENLPTITEKSYKPFLAKQIPLYLSARGHLQYLKKYGFETMEDLLPLNYDSFNTIEKIKTIVDIIKKGKEYIEDFYFSHLREINHNYELVLSDKVENLVLKELQEFLHDI
jgi:hypothetical protein